MSLESAPLTAQTLPHAGRIATNWRKHLTFVLLAALTLLMFGPILIVLFTSLKAPEELGITSFSLFPRAWRFANYGEAMSRVAWARYYLNSTVVTAVAVMGSLLFNSLAGYGFARLRFPGRNLLFLMFIVGIMIPPQSIIIPQFIILRSVPLAGGNNIFGQGGTGWLNTYAALIVPELSGSFGIFLCRQFYLGFPHSLDEAAKIDGATRFQTYIRIFVPLSGPVLATLTILKTVHMWNNFFYPLIMTTTNDMQTVQLALANFRGQNMTDWEIMMAATFVSILPVVFVFLVAQKHYIRGIVTDGIKG
jgi:multiple sugar transport system permease protein